MMTKEQIALDTLSALAGKSDKIKQCRRILQSIIDLDKPKQPIMIADEGFDADVSSHACCPNCKQPIVNVWSSRIYKPLYCHYCGQKIAWDEGEEK